jgi:hypothetical protein
MEEAHPLISHQSQAGQVVEGNGKRIGELANWRIGEW